MILDELQHRKIISGSLYLKHPDHGFLELDNYYGLPETVLLEEEELKGFSEIELLYYKSEHLPEKELELVKTFLGGITGEIQVSLQRVIEKTQIEPERCKLAIKTLIKQGVADIRFYENEGVIVKKGVFCQICSEIHPVTTPHLECKSCGRFVCLTSYKGMQTVGKMNCPLCEGELELKNGSITRSVQKNDYRQKKSFH